ncbi:DEAD/DEAH box helicase [Flavobacterium sp. NST-5]|uniref:DEAD/DEAH box helicase n=1 Tax=Flavobacterium ichthyis TaxID=2698827 RepID=A0ABW9Z7C9_9FLAO|nr:DEAD/DEAH box helicase [Flavobacterium ichthyis]NBL64544.1 DEAD/DEAH box helicase [Flavobacterium ichthyis]
MKLKKINPNLQKSLIENGFEEANFLQEETFSAIKSGADLVIQSPKGTGKTTTIVINAIQKMHKQEGESTRTLILVETKEKVLEMLEIFKNFNRYNNLRVYGVYEKSDMDEDKNQISAGCDILIGTPTKINAMFSSAGFNMTTIKFFAIDDADILLRNRHDSVIARLSESVEKMQRIFFCNEITEKIEILADKIMIEPLFFEMDDDEINFSEE